MSAKYDAAVAALTSHEGLRKKVLAATTAEERAGHLRDHGLDLPTHEEIKSRHAELDDVTGAGTGALNGKTTSIAIGAAADAAAAG